MKSGSNQKHRSSAGKVRKSRRISAQALARQRIGRPPRWPEAKILAARAEVTYEHALRVVQGKRKSPIASLIPAIRAELAARSAA
ncbi:hypothetical protein OpiT1DRAFT_03862 [Opitutaceae bacterium TAV1]|nr:hypothetical protein OpiT1DRAFT_03862 [Opitutaceae bacterium TAV1]